MNIGTSGVPYVEVEAHAHSVTGRHDIEARPRLVEESRLQQHKSMLKAVMQLRALSFYSHIACDAEVLLL